ncbi:MAG: glycosyltransferase family 10 domain-containing protein [bacterium]
MNYKIKFSTSNTYWNWIRQTPERKGVWGNSQFFVNEDIDECDFWFVFENLADTESVKCSPEKKVLITGEPESVKKYDKIFLSQFDTVITSNRLIKDLHIIYSQQGLSWFVGGKYQKETKSWKKEFDKDYDELSLMKSVEKTKPISVMTSDKSFTKGHIKRIEFVKKLKEYFGDKLDVFGIGFNEVEDKWDALSPYKYAVVVENSSYDDYWTEKLSDAYLSFCYPIYYGCKNIDRYFDKDAMMVIDINDFKGSVEKIEKAMSENYYERYYEKIIEARELVLNKYNIFALMSDFVNKNFVDGEKELITIYPQKFFEKEPNIFQKAMSKIKRIFKEIVYGIK